MANLLIVQTTDPVGVLIEDPDNGGVALSAEDTQVAKGHIDAGLPSIDTNHGSKDEPTSHSPSLTPSPIITPPASVQEPDVSMKVPKAQARGGIAGTDVFAETIITGDQDILLSHTCAEHTNGDAQSETNDDEDDELLTRGDPTKTISSGKDKSMPIPPPPRRPVQKSGKPKDEGQKSGKKEKDNKTRCVIC